MESHPKSKSAQPLKVPPHSMEAEQSVLGALMLDNRTWDRVADKISSEDFYRNDHQLIFKSIARLAENSQPFDILTIAENLKAFNMLDKAGGEAYLYQLAQNTPTAANVAAYADIVRERSVFRQLISTGTDITDWAFNPDGRDSHTLLDAAEQRVFQIAEQHSRGDGPLAVSDLLPQATDRIDRLYHAGSSITGTATGFRDFDEITTGLQPGDLIIVAGRPSMGKTTFAMNIAEHASLKSDKPVLIFSLEMPSEQLILRMISSLGRIDQHRLRTGKLTDDDWPRVTSAVGMLSESKMFIDDTPALTPTEMRSRSRRVARQNNGLSLIVVDYLQLMTIPGGKENRAVEISEISRALKTIAKELNVPVIALSQLNRSLESRTDRRPVMSDLRECVVGDTLVNLGDGRRLAISQLEGLTPLVLSMNKNGKIEEAQCEKIWKVGTKEVHKINLASGRSITASSNHRLYTEKSWLEVDSLKVDDRVAVAHNLPENDLFWDRVVSIQSMGEQEVYDLTVPGNASWLADGIISHNSGAIEQDADVIVFIYRDEVYNETSPDKGSAEIIIRKQRNGPIGDFRLTFRGQFTRFENFAPTYATAEKLS